MALRRHGERPAPGRVEEGQDPVYDWTDLDRPTMAMTTTRDDFKYWLADMDDALERFFQFLPEPVRARLDYSPESLDALESWILARYPDTKAMLGPSESRVVDGLARYIGETYRKQIGGRWNIRLDDPKYAFYGIPELTGFAEPS